jgi:hypothetical protein
LLRRFRGLGTMAHREWWRSVLTPIIASWFVMEATKARRYFGCVLSVIRWNSPLVFLTHHPPGSSRCGTFFCATKFPSGTITTGRNSDFPKSPRRDRRACGTQKHLALRLSGDGPRCEERPWPRQRSLRATRWRGRGRFGRPITDWGGSTMGRNERLRLGYITRMEITQPIWHLKTPRCECCSGQGALCFSTCPRCGAVVLVCDEVGTVFPNPRDLSQAVQCGFDDPSCKCPGCELVALADFRHSTSEEIQRLGFQTGEYE